MRMQLNLQFGNIQLGFLVQSPIASLAQAGQFECVSLILELQLFLQLTNIQSGFFVALNLSWLSMGSDSHVHYYLYTPDQGL